MGRATPPNHPQLHVTPGLVEFVRSTDSKSHLPSPPVLAQAGTPFGPSKSDVMSNFISDAWKDATLQERERERRKTELFSLLRDFLSLSSVFGNFLATCFDDQSRACLWISRLLDLHEIIGLLSITGWAVVSEMFMFNLYLG